MCNFHNKIYLSMIKKITVITAILFSLGLSNSALAVLINFDDLTPVYEDETPNWDDNPLTDEYLDQGLRISGAWLVGFDGINSLLTSDWASLSFVGMLPTFVSMNVTSAYKDALIFEVYGSSGFMFKQYSSGWRGIEELSSPPVPREFITINSDVGISSIVINGFYNMRLGGYIDNLEFTYATVPEPSPLILLGLGLFGFALRRFKTAQ